MPKTMVQLAFVQFFTWIALFAMWIYTGTAIADNVFGTVDAQSAAFQEAGNYVGVMFAVYSGVSALAAFLLPILARATSRKFVPHDLPGDRRREPGQHVLHPRQAC
jgi:maltose/moltooligosaccharide transporter